ncbi:unnamed protein product [Gongylonema pulchrum]|uniref:GPHR_N domain-containing protein n=1 Tax=Gongylonema pulchrum TaxID=637853 RepID=A0A183DPF8_9BILA|nr:unnamed protein product [Gongylonema pulchrum]
MELYISRVTAFGLVYFITVPLRIKLKSILHLYEEELQAMDDFDEIVNFLTHLPQSVDINRLFDSIELLAKCCSSSCVENGKHRSFQQVFFFFSGTLISCIVAHLYIMNIIRSFPEIAGPRISHSLLILLHVSPCASLICGVVLQKASHFLQIIIVCCSSLSVRVTHTLVHHGRNM